MTSFQQMLDAMYGDETPRLTEDVDVTHPLVDAVVRALIARENTEVAWPAEATATPPEYPFKLDRHVYGEPASAWRKRAGLA